MLELKRADVMYTRNTVSLRYMNVKMYRNLLPRNYIEPKLVHGWPLYGSIKKCFKYCLTCPNIHLL